MKNRFLVWGAIMLAVSALSAAPLDPVFPYSGPGFGDSDRDPYAGAAKPADPSLLRGDSLEYLTTALMNGPIDVAARDDLVFLALIGGLMIFDVSDPTRPLLISQTPLSHGSVIDMAIHGNQIYLTALDGCLYAIDISDPQNPIKTDSVLTPPAKGIDIKDSLACMAYGYSGTDLGMMLFDISDPGQIDLIGAVSLTYVPQKVLIYNDYAVIVSVEEMTVVDIMGDPPAIYGQVPLEAGYMVEDLNLINDTLVGLAGMDWMYPNKQQSAIILYNLSDPSKPVYVGQTDLMGYVGDIEVEGNLAFVARGDDGVQILDMTDPTAPINIAYYPAAGFAGKVWIDDSLLFFCDRGDYYLGAMYGFKNADVTGDIAEEAPLPGGFQVVNVVDPANSILLGFYNLPYPGTITSAYTADGKVVGLSNTGIDPGLWLIQWTDTMEVYACTTLSPPLDAKSIGDILYLATELGLEIRTFDSSLSLLGQYTVFPGFGFSIAVQGDYAYVSGIEGFRVFNISDPTTPALVAEKTVAGTSFVSVRGDYLYIAYFDIVGEASSDVLVYDISDPENPDSIKAVGHPGFYNGIVAGEKLCAKVDYGAQVFDITDPENPIFEDSVYVDSPAGISLSGLTMYLTARRGGFNIYDISGSEIELVSTRQTPGFATKIFAGDSLLVEADRSGIQIYGRQQISDVDDPEPTLPTDFILYQNYPNPFNPTTIIGFSLPRSSYITLTVYNVLGQRVKSLLEGCLPPGEHKASWNGKDSRGIEVSSGVYFYRLTTANHVSEAKSMLLLR